MPRILTFVVLSVCLALAAACGTEDDDERVGATATVADEATQEPTMEPAAEEGEAGSDEAFEGVPVLSGAVERDSGTWKGELPGPCAHVEIAVGGPWPVSDEFDIESYSAVQYKEYEVEGDAATNLGLYIDLLLDPAARWRSHSYVFGVARGDEGSSDEGYVLGGWRHVAVKKALFILFCPVLSSGMTTVSIFQGTD